MRIGLLGIGRMGLPILRALVGAGHEVVAADPDPARRALGQAAGATVVDEGWEAAASAEVLVTVLPGPVEIEAAMVGDSVLAALRPGSLWIDLTSNDPRVAERLADAAAQARVDTVVAALAGGVAAADGRTLGFFVGATDAALARARPVLEVLGDPARIEHVGQAPGDGNAAKLLVNLLWFGQAAAVTEALLLGRSLGLEPDRLRGVLARSAAGSAFLDDHAESMLAGDYLETFGIDRVVEELDTLTALAAEASIPFELSTLVARLHRDALDRFGPVDGELLVAKLLEVRAGRSLREP
ncbi:MAG: NAD(P)-dependent oxidoreductase [Actinomycetota bacterium]|nr:NAD(P)-dependent oxidoreductase [Actinomycetota bacterium]